MLRPLSGRPIDRRDAYRMVVRIAKAAGIPRHISSHSLTAALDAGVPPRVAQILPRHADPRSTEPYDRARGKPRPPRRPLPHRTRRRRLDLKAPENPVDRNALTWRCAVHLAGTAITTPGGPRVGLWATGAGRQLLVAVRSVRAAPEPVRPAPGQPAPAVSAAPRVHAVGAPSRAKPRVRAKIQSPHERPHPTRRASEARRIHLRPTCVMSAMAAGSALTSS